MRDLQLFSAGFMFCLTVVNVVMLNGAVPTPNWLTATMSLISCATMVVISRFVKR